MARPIKIGLDYFPLDIAIDDSVELLEAECGLQGFAILIKLWQKIYSNGYYIEWSEDNALLFSRKINTGINEVNAVINSCFTRDLLDKTLYEKHQILTSKGIQKRYFKIVFELKRKKSSAISDYLLVNTESIGVNTELTTINKGIKYTKEKKGKEKKYTEDFECIYNTYPRSENKSQTYSNYTKLLKKYDHNELLQCVIRFKANCKDKEKQFITSSSNFFGQKEVYLDYLNDNYIAPVTESIASKHNLNVVQSDMTEYRP